MRVHIKFLKVAIAYMIARKMVWLIKESFGWNLYPRDKVFIRYVIDINYDVADNKFVNIKLAVEAI